MADSEAKLIVNGVTYLIPDEWTLGEERVLKQLTGGKNPSAYVDEAGEVQVDFSDPDIKVFMVWVAMHRVDPRVTVAKVEALPPSAFEFVDESEEETEAAEPSPPAVSELPAVQPEKPPATGSNGGSGSETSDLATNLDISGALS